MMYKYLFLKFLIDELTYLLILHVTNSLYPYIRLVGFDVLNITNQCLVPSFFMALLRTEAQWKQFFQSAGIHDDATSDNYAGIFVTNGFTEISLSEIDTWHHSSWSQNFYSC